MAVNYLRLQLLCILEGPGAAVLLHALKCGTKKLPSVNIHDYLETLLSGTSTANYTKMNSENKRKKFNKDEKKRMASDPSCQNLDISLLYKCITAACEDVAEFNDGKWQHDNEMEGLVSKIKNERNTCVHEVPQMTDQEFQDKVKYLKKLFIDALEAIKVRYSVTDLDTTNIVDKIENDTKHILDSFTDPKVILKMDFAKKLSLFKEEAKSHFREVYKKYVNFDPLSFLSGSPQQSRNIQTIFSKLVLKDQSKSDVEIDCFDILNVKATHGQTQTPQSSQPVQDPRPQLSVVSGVAGSGKSTLLTIILSDWLQEEQDRRVKHLEEFDIVLRILCRDRDRLSFTEFLDQVLPHSCTKLNEPLEKLLTHCKTLFLIDGLDERNCYSDQLVKDILTLSKNTQNDFSILATSRPEPVSHFLAQTRDHFQQCQISIMGIHPQNRTQFVLRYITSTHQARLVSVMKKIENMALFELPLNLLFLAVLYNDNPDAVKDNLTQSSLYINIHDWCTDKLKTRLGLQVCDWGIRTILKSMYEMALQGLLQNKLYLSDQDTEHLKACCLKEDLPHQQVIGAFFTLRSSVKKHIITTQYSMPHKGLQEFFAAKHIMECLQGGPHQESGSIRRILEDSLPTKPLQPRLGGLRNLLWHVAGLLITQDTHERPPEAIKEVITLLAETHVKINDWLTLLEDTDCNKDILQAVAHHITNNTGEDTEEEVEITNKNISSAMLLLPCIPPKTVTILLEKQEVNAEMCLAFSRHRCKRLLLSHHFQHPGHIPASDNLLANIDRSHLKRFQGHLSVNGLALLPPCLEELGLAVYSNHHCHSIITAITSTHKTLLPHLRRLGVHVPMAMIEAGLPRVPLPDLHEGVWLCLSGVEKTNIQKVCQVCVALQPESERRYFYIRFPWAKMEGLRDWRDLLHQLKEHKVRVGGGVWGAVLVPPRTCTEEEEEELNRLIWAWWGCMFRRSNFDDWEEEE